MSFLMSLLCSRRLSLLLLIRTLLLLNFQQNLVQMLLLDVLRKIGKNPRINQRLQRCQSCLRVNHQYLLKKRTQSRILNESTQRLARRNDGLSIFSLNDLRRKVLIEVLVGVFAILKVLLRGSATQTHDQTDLLLFVFPSEERVPKVQLS